ADHGFHGWVPPVVDAGGVWGIGGFGPKSWAMGRNLLCHCHPSLTTSQCPRPLMERGTAMLPRTGKHVMAKSDRRGTVRRRGPPPACPRCGSEATFFFNDSAAT